MPVFDPEYLVQIGKIILIDLALAGDNAVVIALAVRTLPRRQQLLGRLWGTAGAVGLRILFIALATFVLGGLMSVAWVVALGRSGEALANLRVLLRPVYMRLCGVPYVKENLPRRSVGGIPYGAALALGACGVVLWRHG